MTEALRLAQANLLSPGVLAFALGVAATLFRSEFKYPAAIRDALSIYLLLAIGFKGGASLAAAPSGLLWPAAGGLALALAIPLWSFALLRYAGKFSADDAAGIAAHYGSVSVVTFTAATAFLDAAGVSYEGSLTAIMAMLEAPGIVVALFLAARSNPGMPTGHILHEVLTGKTLLLIAGGMVIGLVGQGSQFGSVKSFFTEPFAGVLVLFLLDLGMKAAGGLRDLRKAGAFLVAFGVAMPIVNGALGTWVGLQTGLSVGGAMLLGVLSASASYIAAPAAVQAALPRANSTYYLTAALGITFPFNLVFGIPLYYWMAVRMAG